jgi:Cu/Ag efflux pump CusA
VRRLIALATAALIVLTVAGCGSNESAVVKAKVVQFTKAAADHDYTTICTEDLSPQALADVAEIGCERAMRDGLANVHDARLTVGAVTINGSHASVLTVSQALGEKAVLATIELVDTANGWRISPELGNPVG